MKLQIKSFFTKIILVLFLIIGVNDTLKAQNLLTNGDFESGGSGVGFLVNNYILINPLNGVSTPGYYGRTTNPTIMNSSYISGGDHTTGTGNMLVFDGSNTANQFFWTTTSTGGALGGFTAGTSYVFSYWIKSVSNEVTDSATRSNIGAFFVNASNINPSSFNNLAPLPADGWQKVSYSFTATANNVLIRLKTINTGALGNDFAVDDFSITPGALPLTGSYSSINPTCPNATDGSITVSLSGGILPYNTYHLSGTATQSNSTGIFTGLGAGTYSVSVFDANGQEYAPSNIVLSIPNDLQLSSPTTICSGATTTLTATGGNGFYNWTASPADSSITNPNSATQNVSPLVTTTYTVTSGTASSPTNLVYNGDFSLGNTGFTTEYNQVANPNPFGVQSSYDIVTNPSAWFTPFSSCGDHTSGIGNMLVADGSTDPTGTIKVWCNENAIGVLPNKNYTFSYYLATVSADIPARMEVTINGVSLGAAVTAPSTTCLWTLISYTWNSGTNTTANICIYDRESSSSGNDFALDDISLVETVTCLYQKTVTVTVNPGTIPTFNPVAAICSGDVLSTLPTTSINGYTGTWSPALNNTATTTYTFTPTPGQCASVASLTITVNTGILPTFNSVTAICAGATLNALPTTSINGYTGTWSPALNNTVTTTYTFTPTAGQCAITATLTITVNPVVVPNFNSIPPICAGATLNALPTTSTDGYTGTWSPALNNTTTTTYTFTPTTGQCALTTSLTIIVNPLPEISITAGCNGLSYTLNALQANSSNATYVWFDGLNNQIGTDSSIVVTTAGSYHLVVNQNGCSVEQIIPVATPLCSIQNGISPNNDGLNDSFDLSSYNVSNLKIFNRYGTVAYDKSGYTDQWHGQSNTGNELPDGTYYYVIDFTDSEIKTGWIYINRER